MKKDVAASKKKEAIVSKEERLAIAANKKKEAIIHARSKKDEKDKEEFENYEIDDFPSDEDEISWETNQKFRVGKFIVTNSKDSTESRSRTVRLPKKVIEASKLFKATSFNNQVMFIALNSKSVSKHDPGRGSDVCGLPYCSRKWDTGDPIAVVYVFDLPFNPKNESDQWVCLHHATASVSGYILQLQIAIKSGPKNIEAATNVEETDVFDDLEVLKGSFEKK